MKNIIVLGLAMLLGQFVFAQQSAKKSCCAAKTGSSCIKNASAQTDAAAPAATNFASTQGMVKKNVSVSGERQTAQFQVWGNCGMCKKTIEKAAKNVDGVEKAVWNVDTHQFTVTFDAAKTEVGKIHQAIAAVGYDTDQAHGSDEAYNNLHGCCQYDRKKS